MFLNATNFLTFERRQRGAGTGKTILGTGKVGGEDPMTVDGELEGDLPDGASPSVSPKRAPAHTGGQMTPLNQTLLQSVIPIIVSEVSNRYEQTLARTTGKIYIVSFDHYFLILTQDYMP